MAKTEGFKICCNVIQTLFQPGCTLKVCKYSVTGQIIMLEQSQGVDLANSRFISCESGCNKSARG